MNKDMHEISGDVWTIWNQTPNMVLCITTNGIVKSNGEAVMGKGIALEARCHLGNYITTILGKSITMHGNHVHEIINDNNDPITAALSFPTKEDWRNQSSIDLIKQSSHELMAWLDSHPGKTALLPRPGCGNGGLKWDNVKRAIEQILDDRVYVVNKR
jgi:hypothetical protein